MGHVIAEMAKRKPPKLLQESLFLPLNFSVSQSVRIDRCELPLAHSNDCSGILLGLNWELLVDRSNISLDLV